MVHHRAARLTACGVLALAAGCTTLREIPRARYAERPTRENVRVITRDGLVYDFDWIEVRADTLRGFRRRDLEGRFEEFASLTLPVEDVAQMSRRTLDWYRTGLAGGGLVAAALLAGVGSTPDDPERSSTSGGGQGRPPQ